VVACETGVPHTVWLADTRALMSATRYLEWRAERMRRG
jgi:hypothetical protein